MKHIKNLRTDYNKNELNIKDLSANPIDFFEEWMKDAVNQLVEPNAFVLSTVDLDGMPSSRVLLLRDVSSQGFSFFTNYNSQKANEIKANPRVCMNFFWPELERQVRISGFIETLNEKDSNDYFDSRPYDSQIGAWSSPQSKVIESRDILDKNVREFTQKFNAKVPRPPHWGGYLVKPQKIEFWQGRSSRLHDRFLYTYDTTNWKIERLAP